VLEAIRRESAPALKNAIDESVAKNDQKHKGASLPDWAVLTNNTNEKSWAAIHFRCGDALRGKNSPLFALLFVSYSVQCIALSVLSFRVLSCPFFEGALAPTYGMLPNKWYSDILRAHKKQQQQQQQQQQHPFAFERIVIVAKLQGQGDDRQLDKGTGAECRQVHSTHYKE
jgi:hypothetical protein